MSGHCSNCGETGGCDCFQASPIEDGLVERLRQHRIILKSGDYDGAQLMEAWCDMINAADRIEAQSQSVRVMREENERLREDAERFRALMRCPRIKMQGSAGIDPKTGALTYPDQPGSVHFGAEFWTHGISKHAQDEPTWGRHALRALADDIIAVEARSALGASGHD